jgi:hypothetical protein
MKPRRVLLFIALILILLLAWVWYARPKPTDMAAYAPADSLVYLEANSVGALFEALAATDCSKSLAPHLELASPSRSAKWLSRLESWTGIGSTETLLLSRAQLAVVMTTLGAVEDNGTLTLKPELALLVETHTSARRVKPSVESLLQKLAERSYGSPSVRRFSENDSDFVEWRAPANDRQIVAAMTGSLVVIGNSEVVVKTCLEVAKGRRPSLKDSAEMQKTRKQMNAEDALAFGYVSSENSPRLLSQLLPLIFGRTPADPQLGKLLLASAQKSVGSIGWSSHSNSGAIEDRYLFSLQPGLLSQLRALRQWKKPDQRSIELCPPDFYSLTAYAYEDSAAAWENALTAFSSQVDTLSAIILTTIAKSALEPYGIADPRKFLQAAGTPILTLRTDSANQRSLVIAPVRDERAMREILGGALGRNPQSEEVAGVQILKTPDKQLAAAFSNGNLYLGQFQDVSRCIEWQKSTGQQAHERLTQLTRFTPFPPEASITSYVNDYDRIRTFVLALNQARRRKNDPVQNAKLDQALQELPYATTETNFGDQGLERRTRSCFGQFSSVLPFIFPEQSTAGAR